MTRSLFELIGECLQDCGVDEQTVARCVNRLDARVEVLHYDWDAGYFFGKVEMPFRDLRSVPPVGRYGCQVCGRPVDLADDLCPACGDEEDRYVREEMAR